MLAGIIGWILLQQESTQNYLIQKVSNYLERELNVEVNIDHVNIDFFDKLVLDGFFIEDQKKDTLLYVKQLKADIGLFNILRKEVKVDAIYLDHVVFNLQRYTPEEPFNVQFIIDRFFAPSEGNGEKKDFSWLLNADDLYLNHTRFKLNEQRSGDQVEVFLPKGHLHFKSIDIQNLLIDIESAKLSNPNVYLKKLRRSVADEILGELEEEIEVPVDSAQKTLRLQVADFKLLGGQFKFDNFLHEPKNHQGIDFNRLRLQGIDVEVSNYDYQDFYHNGMIDKINFVEQSGFVLEKGHGLTKIKPGSIGVYDFKLETPNSSIGDTIIFKYRSFYDITEFADKFRLTSQINNSVVAVEDIMAFAPKLRENLFFKEIKDERILVDGYFKGKINNFKAKELDIKLGERLFLKGKMDARDITIPEDAFFQVDIEQLITTSDDLKLILPQANFPDNFQKLGNLDYNGWFTGFLFNFTTEGALRTDLGRVGLNLNLDVRDGLEKGVYKGLLSVDEFDLRTWTENDLFGKASFTTNVKGTGVTGETIKADLDGEIQSFFFKDYEYKKIKIDGIFDKKLFTGKLIADDENIDLTFDGTINFNEEVPKIKVSADITNVDLQALNISKTPLALRGIVEIDLSGDNVDNIAGDGAMFRFDIIQGENIYHLDSILFNSTIDPISGAREINMNSEIAEAQIKGYFNLIQMNGAFVNYLIDYYPSYADKLDLTPMEPKWEKDTVNLVGGAFTIVEKPVPFDKQDFTFSVKVKKANNLSQLFDINLKSVGESSVTGYFNNEIGQLTLGVSVPSLKYLNFDVTDFLLSTTASREETSVNMRVGSVGLGDSLQIPSVYFDGEMVNDTLRFGLNVSNFTDVFTNLNINGMLFPEAEYFEARFLPSNFYIYNEEWIVSGDNHIRFNNKYIKTKNVFINNGTQRISLNGIGNNGLMLNLQNILLDPINDFIPGEKFDVYGAVSADISIQNIFKLQDINAHAFIDTVKIANRNWGAMDILLEANDINDLVNARIKVLDDDHELFVSGTYVSPMHAKKTGLNNPNYFDVQVETNRYPVNFAEHFLKQISDTEGWFKANIRLNGIPSAPNIFGTLEVFDASTKVDYLQTRYYLKKVESLITNTEFNLDGNIVYDENGKAAVIFGGILHERLRNFSMDVTVDTNTDNDQDYTNDEFMLLNTTQKDNPDFYGKAFGGAKVNFKGPFTQINMRLDAYNNENTEIFIPVISTGEVKKASFIEFVQPEDDIDPNEVVSSPDLRGINVDMKLNVNNKATINLIFDDRTGEVMKGKGEGSMEIAVTRTGDFTIDGQFIVEEGEYLFIYQNFINKGFAVSKGGVINWDGDPYDAQINLNAYYEGLETPVYNFIFEYLSVEDNSTTALARRSTPVKLLMALEGQLSQPKITFNMEFPEIDSRLKGAVDSKMSAISGDDNELNRQVFGLIVLGNFLPSEGSGQSTNQFLTSVNTLTELLSNQFSSHLTDLLTEFVDGVGFISNIEFDASYRLYSIQDIEGLENPYTASQLQLGLKNYFLDDRLIINIGGNIDFANESLSTNNQGAYVAGDFVIEYLLTEDGRFRIRAYNRTESGYEEIGGSQRNRTGIGISYSREFDTFKEFIKSFFDGVGKGKKKKEKENDIR